MYSKEQAAHIAALIGFILRVVKIDIAPGEIEAGVGAVLIVIGLISAFWIRYKKGDLKLSGFRK